MTRFCRGVFFNKRIFNKTFLSATCAGLILSVSPSMAQVGMGSIPQFVPASGWQVQKTPLSQLRGLEKMNLPCMMAASYDNGYIVRFSGNQGKMLAMAIDFRQKAFTQGRKYSAKINVDGKYQKTVSGTAFSNSTLIFNLRKLEGFYNAVSDAVKISLDVEGNSMDFAMGGINSALKQLESCAAGQQFSNPSASVQKASLPPPAWSNPMAPKPKMESHMSPLDGEQQASATQNNSAQGGTWQAKAGADMRETLEGWASRAGVKLEWQATNAGQVVSDLSVEGTFEEAVQTLMAQNAAALGLDANMRGKNNRDGTSMEPVMPRTTHAMPRLIKGDRPQSLLPNVSQPVSMKANMGGESSGSLTPLPRATKLIASAPVPIHSSPTRLSPPPRSSMTSLATAPHSVNGSAKVGGGRWSAPAGASLQQILKSWSSKEGVEFIWESNQGFSVLRPVALGGSYEGALQALLGQYGDLRIRPAANLNNDPVTGHKILFVQSSRVL